MATLQAPQMAGMQQQPSPQQTFSPVSIPSVHQMLAAYRAKVQELQSGASTGDNTTDMSMSQNPWAPDEINPNELTKEQRDHQAWLTTQDVSSQKQTIFDQEQHQNMIKNLKDDPAYKEIEGPFTQIVEQVKGYIDNGTITKEQGLQHLMEMEPMIHDAINKHHGYDSATRNNSLLVDPALHTTPELLKKVRGGK